MNRADIPNRVDLRLRYSLSGQPPNQEFIYGVLIFCSTPQSEVEKLVESLKENQDVDVYLLVFEEGFETEGIKQCVALFKESFPEIDIRIQVGYSKAAMKYMYTEMQTVRERRLWKLN